MYNSKQGIKHIEIAVSDLQKSLDFYKPLFKMIGWKEVDKNGFVSGNLKIYLKKWDYPVGNSLGVRHLCFWAENGDIVDKASEYIKSTGVKIIRGPLIVSEYSPDYYTVDFYDPDGFMLEVAHTPNK
ncbi:MAG: VOC family protein [Candidatus Paceibacterota bacterium]